MAIDVSKYTSHSRAGKFEGETPATEYFYEQMLNADGETIYAASVGADGAGFEDVPCAEVFRIDADEAEAFGLPIGHWFLLREDSQGFVYGSVHATREAAEERFTQWVG